MQVKAVDSELLRLQSRYRAMASEQRLARLRGLMYRMHLWPIRSWGEFRGSVNWLGREITKEFPCHPSKQLQGGF